MDKLNALKNAPPPTAAPPVAAAPGAAAPPGATAVVVEPPEDPLEKGFRLVEQVQSKTRDLQNKSMEVKMKGDDVQRSVDPKADGTLVALQKSMDEANKISSGIKRDLDALKRNISDLKKNPEGFEDEAAKAGNADVIRIQENQLQHHTTQFVTVMNEYNAVVRGNEKAIQEQVKQRIKLKFTTDKGCTMSEKDLQALAQEYVSELEADSALLTSAKSRLGEVMENRQDYIKMARSMKELGQLYTDLAAILGEQSVLMDQIHENFSTANFSTANSVDSDICGNPGYVKKNRKCMLWPFGLIAIILMLVLAVILAFSL